MFKNLSYWTLFSLLLAGCAGEPVRVHLPPTHPADHRAQEPEFRRDFAIMLHTWAVHPGTYRPDPAVMLEFNMFTFNSKIFPATDSLVVKTGDRVRIRLANLSREVLPIDFETERLQTSLKTGFFRMTY